MYNFAYATHTAHVTSCARVVPISVAHKSLLRLNLWLCGPVGVARARILLLTMAKCCSCAGKRYKKTMRGKKGKSKVWKKVSAEELRLMKMWYKEDGKAPAEIARLLHRDKGTISRRLHNEGPPQKQGAKCILTPAQVDRLIGKTKAYIKQGTSFWFPVGSHDTPLSVVLERRRSSRTSATRLPRGCHTCATRSPHECHW